MFITYCMRNNMKIEINSLTLDDINCISENFSNDFDKFWSINILKEDFNSESSKYIVAKVDDKVVGIAGVKLILDEANIMNIITKVDKRNLGIGSFLLENLINLCKKNNCNSIFLEVNENNLPAIHLYDKFKFNRIGFRKKYYNNKDNAILMELKLL